MPKYKVLKEHKNAHGFHKVDDVYEMPEIIGNNLVAMGCVEEHDPKKKSTTKK